MNTSLTYSVQIITDSEQLTEALSLRYRTYKKVYPKLLENSNRFYETDAFDSRSIHLGLYCEDGEGKKLAGYCRLILPEFLENKFSGIFIKEHPQYLKDIKNSQKEKLAMMERMPESDCKTINSYCSSLEEKEIIYAETSRFIVDEEHRSISLTSFFVSSMFAIAASLKMGYVFFECQPHHMAFYKRFGFTLFSRISIFDDPILEAPQAIFGTDLNVANALQTSIQTLKLQLETENQITFRKAA